MLELSRAHPSRPSSGTTVVPAQPTQPTTGTKPSKTASEWPATGVPLSSSRGTAQNNVLCVVAAPAPRSVAANEAGARVSSGAATASKAATSNVQGAANDGWTRAGCRKSRTKVEAPAVSGSTHQAGTTSSNINKNAKDVKSRTDASTAAQKAVATADAKARGHSAGASASTGSDAKPRAAAGTVPRAANAGHVDADVGRGKGGRPDALSALRGVIPYTADDALLEALLEDCGNDVELAAEWYFESDGSVLEYYKRDEPAQSGESTSVAGAQRAVQAMLEPRAQPAEPPRGRRAETPGSKAAHGSGAPQRGPPTSLTPTAAGAAVASAGAAAARPAPAAANKARPQGATPASDAASSSRAAKGKVEEPITKAVGYHADVAASLREFARTDAARGGRAKMTLAERLQRAESVHRLVRRAMDPDCDEGALATLLHPATIFFAILCGVDDEVDLVLGSGSLVESLAGTGLVALHGASHERTALRDKREAATRRIDFARVATVLAMPSADVVGNREVLLEARNLLAATECAETNRLAVDACDKIADFLTGGSGGGAVSARRIDELRAAVGALARGRADADVAAAAMGTVEKIVGAADTAAVLTAGHLARAFGAEWSAALKAAVQRGDEYPYQKQRPQSAVVGAAGSAERLARLHCTLDTEAPFGHAVQYLRALAVASKDAEFADAVFGAPEGRFGPTAVARAV